MASIKDALADFEAELGLDEPEKPDFSFLISEPARLVSAAVEETVESSNHYGPVRTAYEQAQGPVTAYSLAVKAEEKKKITKRFAAGGAWEDKTLAEWPDNDIRLFIGVSQGDLGNDVDDDKLRQFFICYPSFAKGKVVRDKKTGKSKGFGFASFLDPDDAVKAFREKNGKYLGSRPIKMRKSTWKDREFLTKEERGKH